MDKFEEEKKMKTKKCYNCQKVGFIKIINNQEKCISCTAILSESLFLYENETIIKNFEDEDEEKKN